MPNGREIQALTAATSSQHTKYGQANGELGDGNIPTYVTTENATQNHSNNNNKLTQTQT